MNPKTVISEVWRHAVDVSRADGKNGESFRVLSEHVLMYRRSPPDKGRSLESDSSLLRGFLLMSNYGSWIWHIQSWQDHLRLIAEEIKQGTVRDICRYWGLRLSEKEHRDFSTGLNETLSQIDRMTERYSVDFAMQIEWIPFSF